MTQPQTHLPTEGRTVLAHVHDESVTYDARQAAAVLITCESCGRAFYFTHPKPVCVECREAVK